MPDAILPVVAGDRNRGTEELARIQGSFPDRPGIAGSILGALGDYDRFFGNIRGTPDETSLHTDSLIARPPGMAPARSPGTGSGPRRCPATGSSPRAPAML